MENKALFLREFIHETLYNIPEPAPSGLKYTDSPEKNKNLPLLSGNINADVLLLFNYPDLDEAPARDNELLMRILSSVNISPDKIAWLSTGLQPGLRWQEVMAIFLGSRIIIFEPDSPILPLACEEGRVAEIGGRKVLAAAPLAELHANKSRKELLWSGLQEMFRL